MFNMMSADDTGWMVAGIVAAIFLGLVIATAVRWAPRRQGYRPK